MYNEFLAEFQMTELGPLSVVHSHPQQMFVKHYPPRQKGTHWLSILNIQVTVKATRLLLLVVFED